MRSPSGELVSRNLVPFGAGRGRFFFKGRHLQRPRLEILSPEVALDGIMRRTERGAEKAVME
jgi:hypothetical protein